MLAFIPEIGTEVENREDWTFELYQEYRNSDIYLADGKKEGSHFDLESYTRTLPAGSRFAVDRIYVRKGAKEFSSVTLRILDTTDAVLVKAKGNRKSFGRFWVKLADFNNANFSVVVDTSISADASEDHNEPATLAMIKRRNGHGQKYWVKFEHEDPELSFEGEVNVYKFKPVFSSNSCHNPGFPHTVSSRPGYGGSRNYTYAPKYFFESLVADSWKEARKGDKRYEKTVPNPFYYGRVVGLAGFGPKTMEVVKHPLEDQLHIPTEKKERLPLGIKTDKTDLVDIPLAGGKLSIYDIKLV